MFWGICRSVKERVGWVAVWLGRVGDVIRVSREGVSYVDV